MKLDVYRRKRDFRRTPEPRGTAARTDAHHFVVQKHAARRLHYDFRLELNGTLKSWAVPKGPSLDPRARRLAVHVEDHPIEYGRFEGVIPKPGYGAGTVLVWDRGVWRPEGDPEEGYRRGRLHFKLDGEKLRGGWTLVRTTGGDDKNWLLIKSDDEYASKLDIVDALPDSVQSGRSLDDVAAPRAPAKRRSPLPALLEPQLATLVDAPPDGPEWLHEIKYDGYRVLCRIGDGNAELYSRNGKPLTQRMLAVARAAERLPGLKRGWLDGEVVALQSDGRTSFSALQQALSDGRDRDLIYYVFDLPYYNDADVTGEPLRARKARLAALLSTPTRGPIRYSDHIPGDGPMFHRQACEFGLEGIISKRADGPYRPGRTHDWLKSKCRARQEFVVGGYSEPGGNRKGIGALLVGVYDRDGRLHYAGRIGTGFDDPTLIKLRRRLERLHTDGSPFAERLRAETRRGAVHWVRPQTVIEAEFAGWTHDNMVRQGSFQGVREDKPAREVTRERALSLAHAAGSPVRAIIEPSRTNTRLTHADKVLYPEQGLTKRDLALYYEAVADGFLPHAKDRPLTLVRCPAGRQKKCFYQKHAAEGTPPELVRVPITEDHGTKAVYLAIKSLAGVLALVQMGVLEIHVWGARIDRPDYPDRLVFDLDPDPAVAWDEVVAAAHLTRTRLADLGLVSYARTTGGKGLHVVLPLARRHNWDQAKTFAKALAEDLVRQNPERYTARLPLAARRGKIFIDYLRNGRGATAVTNYSTRARPNATVAVPLLWDEVKAELRPEQYTVTTVPARLKARRRDPWSGFTDARQTITKKMRRELGLD